VVDASSCKPIRGATVEVWHCDALGRYSGFNAPGRFLRGGQRSGATGHVTFKTIYPGWYSGRTTHIHVKVHVGGNEVHTGQLYFADATSAAVYRSRSPYRSRGQKDHAERCRQRLRVRRAAVDAAAGEERLGLRRAACAGRTDVTLPRLEVPVQPVLDPIKSLIDACDCGVQRACQSRRSVRQPV
jgi:protocatechuate 3,4-dioxygenase beta subunit